MGTKFNRKEFLRIGTGAAAGIIVSGFLKPVWGREVEPVLSRSAGDAMPALLTLDADPPLGTTAVRYYINDVRVSELTNLYALQTSTTPVWKTVVASEWLNSGEQQLRVEADTPDGPAVLRTDKIFVPGVRRGEGDLTGAWYFSDAADLPAGMAEGKTPSAARKDYDHGNWTKILVPNSLGYQDKKWNKPEGLLGVYRRHFSLSSPKKGEQFAIVLQSCYWYGRVFVNGHEVGDTRGGYLPTRFDITSVVHAGDNTVAIIVDNRLTTMGVFKRLHAFYWNWGGLLQEVSITRDHEVAVIEMRATGSQEGKLRLWLTGLNVTGVEKMHEGTVAVFDPAGKCVLGPQPFKIKIEPGGIVASNLEVNIGQPKLWNLDTPHLYTVVWQDAHRSLKERTGFRDVRAVGGDLMINGKVVGGLQGFDRHGDYPGLGRTQSAGLVYREMKILYDKGFRIFRPAHYPTTPAELDAADELGMLVLEEINVTGLKGLQLATAEVKAFGAQQLKKLIQRDRSHPCIFAWSVGNENLTDEQGADEYVRETISLGRSLDDSRLFTHVTMRATRDKTFQYQDFVAQNYYAGWYTKDVDAIAGLIDSVQAYAGNKPILLSEYGAEAVLDRPGTGKGTEFYQGFVVDAHNRLLDGRKHFIGKLYWSSTEFWCRPAWTGGNPAPVPPFHVKALKGYYRQQDKLGWRVMFSPIRLSLKGSNIKETQFGAEVSIPAGESTKLLQIVKITEIRGGKVEGNLIILPPLGFKGKKYSYPFVLEPYGSQEITVSVEGALPESISTSNGFVKAVIDDETEAQPLVLTVTTSGV